MVSIRRMVGRSIEYGNVCIKKREGDEEIDIEAMTGAALTIARRIWWSLSSTALSGRVTLLP